VTRVPPAQRSNEISPLTAYERAEREVPAAVVDVALAGAKDISYWLDSPDRPVAEPALSRDTAADLLVIGGGFTGLWTALLAKERDPDRDVLLLEGHECGWAASGRNGGFVSTSLTHGHANGLMHVPDEVERLDELGRHNVEAIRDAIERYGIDCDFEWNGSMTVAVEDHHVESLQREHEADPVESTFFDQDQVRAEVASPLFRAGLWWHRESALVDPARLAWGLRRACLQLGVRIHEHSPVPELRRTGSGAAARVVATVGGTVEGLPARPGPLPQETYDGGHQAPDGSSPRAVVTARRVALATNAYRSLLPGTGLYTVPVYDYALMTEPLSQQQSAALGWRRRQGLEDPDSRFHYYRLATDRATGRDRILFGGYDAVYHFGRRVSGTYDQRPETFRRLAAHVLATFPQLEGVRFSHQWGGAIDTCSRFFAFFDTAHGGLTARAAGFTGLGVGASRFAAEVMLDLLSGQDTELTRLQMVRRKPAPFPPDPLAWAGIQITQREMARADRRGGRRGLWLRFTDALGMGFDS
jgi:glycine/D-amino acid oxidase-like deaminating enzyme